MNTPSRYLKLLSIGAILAAAASLHADMTYHVSLDTAGLQGSPSAPFSLDFQLFDGTGLGNANTTVSLWNFNFGGGSAGATTFDAGGVSGDLGSKITLTDSSFYNEFFQDFTPGSTLQFDVQIDSSWQSGGTPDEFSFAILDNNLFNLPTNALATDTFANVETDGTNFTVLTASSLDGTVPAPTVTPVPEASTYGLFGAALLGLAALKRRRAVA
jgi:MYXO-CTERM domain-containing protein